MTKMTDADHIRNAIQEILKDDGEEPHMVGGIVVLAEMTHSDGDVYLFTLNSGDLTPWGEIGMLQHRLMTVQALLNKFELESD